MHYFYLLYPKINRALANLVIVIIANLKTLLQSFHYDSLSLSIFLSLFLSLSLSISLLIFLSLSQSLTLSLSISPSLSLSQSLTLSISRSLSISLSLCPSIPIPISLSLSFSQCVYMSPSSSLKVFTGRGGRFVQLEDTIKGFQEILSGKLDSLPEGAFYMAGNIDEVKETAAKMATA